MKILFVVLLLVFSGFASFGQEEEKPTPLELRVAEEAQKIQENTNWNNPEESRKAMIKLGKLMQEVDKEAGIVTEGFPLDTMPHEAPVIGAERAESLAYEIARDFEMDEGTGEIPYGYYQETTFLALDLENAESGLSLADLKFFDNLQILYIKGTKSGAEIDLDSIFIHLENKPVTEFYLVRNNAGTRNIPESIGKLTKLKKLGLYNNEIHVLSNSISGLNELEELYIDLNPIEKLPEGIDRLKNLKIIGIAKTGINENERSRLQKLIPNCKILSE